MAVPQEKLGRWISSRRVTCPLSQESIPEPPEECPLYSEKDIKRSSVANEPLCFSTKFFRRQVHGNLQEGPTSTASCHGRVDGQETDPQEYKRSLRGQILKKGTSRSEGQKLGPFKLSGVMGVGNSLIKVNLGRSSPAPLGSEWNESDNPEPETPVLPPTGRDEGIVHAHLQHIQLQQNPEVGVQLQPKSTLGEREDLYVRAASLEETKVLQPLGASQDSNTSFFKQSRTLNMSSKFRMTLGTPLTEHAPLKSVVQSKSILHAGAYSRIDTIPDYEDMLQQHEELVDFIQQKELEKSHQQLPVRIDRMTSAFIKDIRTGLIGSGVIQESARRIACSPSNSARIPN